MFPCRAVQGQKSFLEQIAAQKRRLISLRGSAGKVMGAGRIFPGIVAVGSGQLIIHKVGDGELHRSRPGFVPGKNPFRRGGKGGEFQLVAAEHPAAGKRLVPRPRMVCMRIRAVPPSGL